MPKPAKTPINQNTFREWFESKGYIFEMKAAGVVSTGWAVSHSASFVDPTTEKLREIDVRAQIDNRSCKFVEAHSDLTHTLAATVVLTVECKDNEEPLGILRTSGVSETTREWVESELAMGVSEIETFQPSLGHEFIGDGAVTPMGKQLTDGLHQACAAASGIALAAKVEDEDPLLAVWCHPVLIWRGPLIGVTLQRDGEVRYEGLASAEVRCTDHRASPLALSVVSWSHAEAWFKNVRESVDEALEKVLRKLSAGRLPSDCTVQDILDILSDRRFQHWTRRANM